MIVVAVLAFATSTRESPAQATALSTTSQPATTAPAPPWVTAPARWTLSTQDELVLLEPPKPADSAAHGSARIALTPPIKFAGLRGNVTLGQFLAMVQKPDPVVSRSDVTSMKNQHGHEILNQSLVVESSPGRKLWRTYNVVRDGEWAVLVLFTAESEVANDEHRETLRKFVNELDLSRAPRREEEAENR